jgi:hypothetical protein
VDAFIEYVMNELHRHEQHEGALRARSQQLGARPVIPLNKEQRRKRTAPKRNAVVKDSDDDALAPFAGMVGGALAALVIWAVLAAAVLTAYGSTPSWLTAIVQTVLLAAEVS